MLSKNLGLLWCIPLLACYNQFSNFTWIFPRTMYLGRCFWLSKFIERGRDIQLLSFRNWFFIQLILSGVCDQLLCLAVAFWLITILPVLDRCLVFMCIVAALTLQSRASFTASTLTGIPGISWVLLGIFSLFYSLKSNSVTASLRF